MLTTDVSTSTALEGHFGMSSAHMKIAFRSQYESTNHVQLWDTKGLLGAFRKIAKSEYKLHVCLSV
jgi:hypothetical protein